MYQQNEEVEEFSHVYCVVVKSIPGGVQDYNQLCKPTAFMYVSNVCPSKQNGIGLSYSDSEPHGEWNVIRFLPCESIYSSAVDIMKALVATEECIPQRVLAFKMAGTEQRFEEWVVQNVYPHCAFFPIFIEKKLCTNT